MTVNDEMPTDLGAENTPLEDMQHRMAAATNREIIDTNDARFNRCSINAGACAGIGILLFGLSLGLGYGFGLGHGFDLGLAVLLVLGHLAGVAALLYWVVGRHLEIVATNHALQAAKLNHMGHVIFKTLHDVDDVRRQLGRGRS